MQKVVIKTAQTEEIVCTKEDSVRKGQKYKVITLKETGLIKTQWGMLPRPDSQCRTTRITVWEKNPFTSKPDDGYAEPIFDNQNPTLGGYLLGGLETRKVQQYVIEKLENGEVSTRSTDLCTCLVLGESGTLTYERAVLKAFKRAGRVIVDNTVLAATEESVDETSHIS